MIAGGTWGQVWTVRSSSILSTLYSRVTDLSYKSGYRTQISIDLCQRQLHQRGPWLAINSWHPPLCTDKRQALFNRRQPCSNPYRLGNPIETAGSCKMLSVPRQLEFDAAMDGGQDGHFA